MWLFWTGASRPQVGPPGRRRIAVWLHWVPVRKPAPGQVSRRGDSPCLISSVLASGLVMPTPFRQTSWGCSTLDRDEKLAVRTSGRSESSAPPTATAQSSRCNGSR